MIIIDLDNPHLFTSNFSPNMTGAMAEQMVAAFSLNGHRSGVKMKAFNTRKDLEDVTFTWDNVEVSSRRRRQEEPALLDQAAEGISLLLADKVMGYDQYETAGKRKGADYWLYKSDPDGLMQSFSALLEISAIGQCERRAMAEHLGLKQRQQQNSYSRISLPVLFSIVEFSEPKILLERSDLETVHLESCRIKLDELNEELIRSLAAHPDTMYDLSPRKYEELVAELLRVMGYDVYLTQQTRDGGRDIAAVEKASNGSKLLTLVECKRHRGDRPVGIDLVQRFMWTKNEVRANVGMIATTSYFTRDAQEFQKKHQWDLNFHDFKDMKDWLNNYGKWVQSDEHHGIWLPSDPSM